MKFFISLFFIGIVLSVFYGLVSCQPLLNEISSSYTAEGVHLPPFKVWGINPANQNCLDHGGEIVKEERPMCKLPDGRIIDVWGFFIHTIT
ncbi:hypothetical protein PPL_02720 [Heterostelium album PN500]|uniref:DUF333 domain-containing protein n=1 Tax=Heterostelium pallidum (strain ATCC 26659 / Pp 5 / PN500) TaxID=670386 RepID=D3B2V6_HETP5|nr:hypothetical protein PPL_02720 [Heterostelium album PN500]EFA83654.1 hypothetical protein PPL_02720 [Heterostelium album PN500]|eukprot:XP_020435771.1 hypothetical protein PPL_02720 [Heterostelium album PN500]